MFWRRDQRDELPTAGARNQNITPPWLRLTVAIVVRRALGHRPTREAVETLVDEATPLVVGYLL